MGQHPDVLIIGGGVIGLTTAYYLAQDGARVEVVDKSDFGQEASWAGAGILVPAEAAYARTPVDQLRVQSWSTFPKLSAELRERTGIDNGYQRCGGLEFGGGPETTAEDEWRGRGAALKLIDEQTVQQLEPACASGLGKAYHLPDMAQLRNPRHLKALLAACQALGVRLRADCPIQGFVQRDGHVTAVKTALEQLPAGRFLVATGSWTDAILEQLGWRPGIRPIRGQIALLDTGNRLFRHLLLWGPRYIVPRSDGIVLIGSTEEDAGFDKRTTAGAIADLLAFGCRLVPDLAKAPVERCWAGLRPQSPDGSPFLGPVPGCDNLFVAAGHFRSGIQLSPATALVMKELILGQPLTLSLEPFRLDRATRRQ